MSRAMQVRLWKINVARRSHSRRQQPIPPLTAACPPRAGAEDGTICGNIGSDVANSRPPADAAPHNPASVRAANSNARDLGPVRRSRPVYDKTVYLPRPHWQPPLASVGKAGRPRSIPAEAPPGVHERRRVHLQLDPVDTSIPATNPARLPLPLCTGSQAKSITS